MRLRPPLAAVLLLLAVLPVRGASAQQVTHRVQTANFLYIPSEIVIASGNSLQHGNSDAEPHDLVSVDQRPDGKPWFQSQLIGPGETDFVPVENLPAGKYPFICSIHPFMGGTLYVDTVPDEPPSVRPPPPPEPQEAPRPAEVEIETGDNFFAPRTITVPVGTTISWTNTGVRDHTVTDARFAWDSNPLCPGLECMDPGDTFRRTFDEPGVNPYFCKLHGTPSGIGHAGTIVVVPPGAGETAVQSLAVGGGGGSLSVSGSASFGGEGPLTLATDPAGDGPPESEMTGTDLTGARVYRPDPGIDAVFFEWRLAGLPDEGVLPEAVRYTLPFRAGGEVYVLRAKRTAIADPHVAEDPEGSADHAGHAFALRGDCEASPFPRCAHLAWLTGSFDLANGIVRVKLPLGEIPGLDEGTLLEPNAGTPPALSRIEAAYDALVPAEDLADGAPWAGGFTYRIAAREVLLGIAPAGTPEDEVAFGVAATVSELGGFGGSISAPGPGEWDVWARACFGTSCASTVRPVTI